MLFAAPEGGLEVRQNGDGSRTVRGSFPYGSTATLSDGGRRGRPRKERFAPHAFEYRVEERDAEVNLLVGHDFDRPLASKLNDTLKLRDTDEALSFEATIPPEVAKTTHAQDALALMESGLATGISPGFRLPPERVVKDAEEITQEPDNPEKGQNGATIRTVKAALLFELSIVTKPAFEDAQAQVEARRWSPTGPTPGVPVMPVKAATPATATWRWRA